MGRYLGQPLADSSLTETLIYLIITDLYACIITTVLLLDMLFTTVYLFFFLQDSE